MKTVAVKRIVKIGQSPCFQVSWDDNIKTFLFSIDVAKDSIWNEEVNKQAALEFAKKIEDGLQLTDTEEIIYQSSKTESDGN